MCTHPEVFLQCLPTLGRAGPASTGDWPHGPSVTFRVSWRARVHMGGSRETLGELVCVTSAAPTGGLVALLLGAHRPVAPGPGGPLQQHSPEHGRGWSPREGSVGSAPAKAQTCRDATAAVVSRARVGSAGETCPQPSLVSEGAVVLSSSAFYAPSPRLRAAGRALCRAVSRVCSSPSSKRNCLICGSPLSPHGPANPSRRTSHVCPWCSGHCEREYSLRSPGRGGGSSVPCCYYGSAIVGCH